MVFEYKPVRNEQDLRELEVGDVVRFVGGPYHSGSTNSVSGRVVRKSESLQKPLDYYEFARVEPDKKVPRQWRVDQSQFSQPGFYTAEGSLRDDGLFPEGHEGKTLMKL